MTSECMLTPSALKFKYSSAQTSPMWPKPTNQALRIAQVQAVREKQAAQQAQQLVAQLQAERNAASTKGVQQTAEIERLWGAV